MTGVQTCALPIYHKKLARYQDIARRLARAEGLGEDAARALAEEGKAVVVISSYLPEILAVSDRILVARLGRIVAEFDGATATEDKIMYAAIH